MSNGFAQHNKPTELRIWKLTNYSGSVGVRGFYIEKDRMLNNVSEISKNPFIGGKLSLFTSSYIGHPQLLKLDISGEFSPGRRNETFTLSQNRSENITLRQIHTRATLGSGKPMSLSGHRTYSQNIIAREYVSSQAGNNNEWGLSYNYRNKFLPIISNYTENDMNQEEIETGRSWIEKSRRFLLSSNRSFTKNNDRNEISFTRYEFFRSTNQNTTTHNLREQFFLNNTYYLDKYKKYRFQSNINNLNQYGNLFQKRLQITETVAIRLHETLNFSGSYDYNKNDQLTQSRIQHRIEGRLYHQLFSSLSTSVNYSRLTGDHTSYEVKNRIMGVTFTYTKKIPKGILTIRYSYQKNTQSKNNKPNSIQFITDEPHTLVDGQIEVLYNPYVIASTVLVKDALGAVVYQLGFDYQLIEKSSGFTEIYRIPGGQIPNNGQVLVDYMADQLSSYHFDVNTTRFTTKVVLFKNLLEIYYTKAKQYYSNVEFETPIPLTYFDQDIIGGEVHIGPFTTGAEWDRFKSTIVPYDRKRVFVNFNSQVKNKLTFSLNGDLTDLIVTKDTTEQVYANLSGQVAYTLPSGGSFDLTIGYRRDFGDNINLDMTRGKLEFNQRIRQLFLKVGFEMYKRIYYGDDIRYKGVYFSIDRRF